MQDLQFVTLERRDHVAWLTINRPQAMNALHPPANEEMDRVWNALAADDDVWVAVLTGAGEKAFSAGNDLKWTAEHGMPTIPRSGFGGLTARYDFFKPIIAAVNGFALGGGLEMALACDVIVAAEHATLGLPEPKVGLMAAAGGVHRLPRVIPHHIAMGMMLTGRHITAAEAHRWGLVNEVVPSGELHAAAARWASEIAACSPLSVRASKEAALRGRHLSVEEAMRATAGVVAKLFTSEDAVEGPRAFAQKRKPSWKGR